MRPVRRWRILRGSGRILNRALSLEDNFNSTAEERSKHS